jgi:hypothetical protein
VAFLAGRGRALYAIAGAVVAAAAAIGIFLAVSGPGGNGTATARPAAAPVRLSGAPLGLNVAPWDYVYAARTSAGGGLEVMQPMLRAAGIGQFRYGGSYAEYYDWRTNKNIGTSNPTCPHATEGAAAGTQTLATSYSTTTTA